MSYFGGLGAGKGWDKFKFVVTPDELRSVFADLEFWFVVTNRRVNVNYKVDDRTSFFKGYEDYFKRVTSGLPWDKRKDWEIESNVRLSITRDPNKIIFEDIIDKGGIRSKEFKLVRPQEPVVNVAPFYLHYGEGGVTIETMNEEGILGLELSFPKVVTFKNEGHLQTHKTEEFPNQELLEKLTERIRVTTKKPKLLSQKKTFRPNFRISVDAIDLINRNHYLTKNNLSLN